MTLKPGDEATLKCRGRGGADISLMKWTKGQSIALFCRDDVCIPSYQDPAYRGRAEAVDPRMEDGEASMVLRNVAFEDAGRFECHVLEEDGRGKRETKVRSVVNLKVNKDLVGPEPSDDGGVRLIVGLAAAAAVGVVVAVRALLIHIVSSIILAFFSQGNHIFHA